MTILIRAWFPALTLVAFNLQNSTTSIAFRPFEHFLALMYVYLCTSFHLYRLCLLLTVTQVYCQLLCLPEAHRCPSSGSPPPDTSVLSTCCDGSSDYEAWDFRPRHGASNGSDSHSSGSTSQHGSDHEGTYCSMSGVWMPMSEPVPVWKVNFRDSEYTQCGGLMLVLMSPRGHLGRAPFWDPTSDCVCL